MLDTQKIRWIVIRWCFFASVTAFAVNMLTEQPEDVFGFSLLVWVIIQNLSIFLSIRYALLHSRNLDLFGVIGLIGAPLLILGSLFIMLSNSP